MQQWVLQGYVCYYVNKYQRKKLIKTIQIGELYFYLLSCNDSRNRCDSPSLFTCFLHLDGEYVIGRELAVRKRQTDFHVVFTCVSIGMHSQIYMTCLWWQEKSDLLAKI